MFRYLNGAHKQLKYIFSLCVCVCLAFSRLPSAIGFTHIPSDETVAKMVPLFCFDSKFRAMTTFHVNGKSAFYQADKYVHTIQTNIKCLFNSCYVPWTYKINNNPNRIVAIKNKQSAYKFEIRHIPKWTGNANCNRRIQASWRWLCLLHFDCGSRCTMCHKHTKASSRAGYESECDVFAAVLLFVCHLLFLCFEDIKVIGFVSSGPHFLFATKWQRKLVSNSRKHACIQYSYHFARWMWDCM